jgi:hypothetical protein
MVPPMPLSAAKIPDYTTPIEIALDEIEDAALRCALAYWRSIRGERRFPTRADIKPRDIASILRHISLLKCEKDDFRYRIVGDVIVRAFDLPLQNRCLSELSYEEPGFGAIARPLLQRCADSGEVIAVRGRTGRDLIKVTFTHYENVLLPLGPDDGAVDHIMVVSAYHARPQY